MQKGFTEVFSMCACIYVGVCTWTFLPTQLGWGSTELSSVSLYTGICHHLRLHLGMWPHHRLERCNYDISETPVLLEITWSILEYLKWHETSNILAAALSLQDFWLRTINPGTLPSTQILDISTIKEEAACPWLRQLFSSVSDPYFEGFFSFSYEALASLLWAEFHAQSKQHQCLGACLPNPCCQCIHLRMFYSLVQKLMQTEKPKSSNSLLWTLKVLSHLKCTDKHQNI